MWFNKFSNLIYIAYLNVEKTIRDISLFAFAAGAGILLYFAALAGIEIPSDYLLVTGVLVIAGLWNALLFLLVISLWLTLLTLTWSAIKVAYWYDGESWGYVKDIRNFADKINNQLDVDEYESERQRKAHADSMKSLVEKLKSH